MLFLACLFTVGFSVSGNATVVWTSNVSTLATATLTVCENSGANSYTNLIHVNESGAATINWSILSGPTDGTLTTTTGTRTTSGAGGTNLAPNFFTNFRYTPNAGFYGTDNITVRVTDDGGATYSVMSITVVVDQTPDAISGASSVCRGQTITLSDDISGGTWSSNNTPRASVDVNSGVVTGGGFANPFFAQNVTITYTLAGNGCNATTNIVVNPLSPITGANDICAWTTNAETVADATNGGVWSSTVAPVSTNGVITGQYPGAASVTYTMPTGCTTTATFTVNPLPDPIAAVTDTNVCVGSTISFTETSSGGTWSTDNTSIATVDASGNVTGVSQGNVNVIYTFATGCSAMKPIVVNPVPGNINTDNVCLSQTVTLMADPSGGTWTTGSTDITLMPGGDVTGVNAATAVVTYTLPTGCNATYTVTVNPLPGPITGITTLCQNTTTNLSDTTSGGNWSIDNTSVATIDGSGLVTGVGYGSINASYTLTTGCYATAPVTVNQIGNITGRTHVCKFSTVTLNDVPSGGAWSSSNANATIDPTSGVVTGVDAGTTTITYTTTDGCFATRTETVDSLPTLTGGSVCIGSEIALDHSPTGGRWSSSNTSVATIFRFSFAGHVHGVGAGVDTITYTLFNGCANTATVVVNPIYPISASATSVCVGFTVTLSDDATGGTWSASNTNVSVDGSGTVTGMASGSSTVTYTTPAGCTAMIDITVNPQPNNIGGTASACVNGTTQLNDGGGGNWTTDNGSIATVDGTGLVYGVTPGTVNVTYTLGTGCFVSEPVVINPVGVITGIPYVCPGTTTMLSDTVGGGTWITNPFPSPYMSVSNLPGSYGVVTGDPVNTGSTEIQYVLPTGCIATYTVTNGQAPPIMGPNNVCEGSMITLRDTVSGGTWSMTNTADATVDPSSGVVTGVATGSATVVYTLAAGCSAQTNITVNTTPTVSNTQVCVGSNVALTYSPIGGTWSTSDASVATVNQGFFVFPRRVIGVSAGMDTVTYTLNTGCAATATVTVNPLPGPIVGGPYVCPGVTITLSDSTTGGVWSSSSNFRATIDPSTGVVTGVNATGFTQIAYTLSATGCRATTFIQVSNALPNITGGTMVCVGQSIDLNDAATGGTWTSQDGTIGSVDDTGAVTGLSAGTTIITYSLGGTCRNIHSVQVDALSPITGTTTVCQGSTVSLSDTTFGGNWISDNAAVATVDANGTVYGVDSGMANIDYILPTGCWTSTAVTVNPLPTPISGIGYGVCLGSTITSLSDGTAGGTWSSSDNTIASIDSATGWVTGVAAGTVTITYSLPTGCGPETASLTVNALPVLTSGLTAGPICNNVTFTYNPTSDMDPHVIYNWQRDTVSGIANGSNVNSGSISETLNDTTANPVTVEYVYTFYNDTTLCTNIDTVKVIVNPTPMLSSMLPPLPVCHDDTFTYVSTSLTAGTTFAWSRDTTNGILNSPASGTGNTIHELLVNVTNDPVPVTYVDTLWANGCMNTENITVTVNPKALLSTDTISSIDCDSSLVTFTPTSPTGGTGITSYVWHRNAVAGISNPAASDTFAINEYLYNTTPDPITVTYVYTLTANDCSNTQSVTVTVEPKLMLTSPLNAPPICDSTLFSYVPTSATTGGDITFTWTRPYVAGIDLLAGSGTGNPNEILINSTNTDVVVTYHYTISAYGCSAEQDVHVLVHPRPLLQSPTGPFETCSESQYTYGPTAYVTGTTFAWTVNPPAGVSSSPTSGTNAINAILVDSTLTPKTVTFVYLMTFETCTNTASVTVVVNPSSDVPPITVYPSQAPCTYTMYQNFGVASPAPAGVNYIWTAVNATVYATGTPNQYAIISFDSAAGPATITVTSNVTGFACTHNQVYTTTVGTQDADRDIQVIYYNGQFMCLNNLQDTYRWGYDDGVTLDSTIIPGEVNQTYFCNAPDLTYRHYWVITTHNGCMQKTYYNPPLGVTDANADATEVKLYPNPANDMINVDINTTKTGGKYDVEVLDVLGQKITTVTAVNRRASINVANLATGIYLIETYRDGVKINASRFVKN